MNKYFKNGLLTTLVVIGAFTSEVWASPPTQKSTPQQTTVEPQPVVTNSFKMTFMFIKPGKFMMGSPLTEEGRGDNETQHEVTITKGFYMQTTEVTQAQWVALMGSNPSSFKGDDLPVGNVSWDNVEEYIQKLNKSGNGTYRLPTEAEWEYAARAGSRTSFSCGERESCLSEMGWFGEYSSDAMHSVGQKKPNAWGLYDMHGNVCEWVQDWYGNYPVGAVIDPSGPNTGETRVFRGGAYTTNANLSRSAFRSDMAQDDHDFFLGFRLVRLP